MSALLIGIVGLLAAAYGLGVHLPRLVLDGPSAGTVAGIALGVAGLAAVVVAARRALRGRRWPAKLLAVVLTLVLAQWFVFPVILGGVVSNAGREDVPNAGSLALPGARDVRFAAADGVPLAGWFVPGRAGAAVVVLHGSHGTRADTAGHVRMLARRGYAVLSFDARGHGESGGDPNAAGWTGVEDAAGAVAFLRSRPAVDADRIAGLGLSMGGEILLRASAEDVPLAAVVADGAGASTLGDQRLVEDGVLPTSVTWMSMRASELFTGDDEPEPLHRVARRITAPVLLIASNAPHERELDETFRSRIGPGATVWSVPDAGHTKALDEHPREYAARVGSFLEAALEEDRHGR